MSKKLKCISIFFLISITLILCSKKKKIKTRMFDKSKIISSSLTLDQKIGQMIMLAIPGYKMNWRTRNIIKKYYPGGVILFGFNFHKNSNLKKLLKEVQRESLKYSKIPLFITLDQEGGRVKRITEGITQFPGNMAAGIANNEILTYKMAKIVGLQLKILGINMNLAPVLDINNNPDNPVINIRSFGSNTLVVSKMGTSYIRGLQDAWCIAVGKHFPGHGDTNKDSHLTMPVINYGLERLTKIEFPPFIKAINEGVEGIMTAHIAFPKILNSLKPATLSNKFLTDILRKKMKFKGLIFTDAIEMKGLTKKMDMGKAAVQSILAGADIVLLTSYGKNIPKVVSEIKRAVKKGEITIQRIEDSVNRILELKLRYKIAKIDKDKKVNLAENIMEKKNRKLLNEADTINTEISKKAIYYFGDVRLLVPGEDTVRIFISKNKIIRDTIKTDKNDLMFYNVYRFFRKNINLLKGKKKILYYHSNIINPNIKLIKYIAKKCKDKNIKLIIISSNNPFPIIRSGLSKSILMSFSDTYESIKQLGICLNGGFTPKTKINFDLGL